MVTRQPGHRPRIEVLYVPECPHYPGALALVERIRGELGIDTELRTSLISDQAAAERARFPGSPTIRVDGRDVEPGSPSTRLALLACRLYRHEQGLAGKPAEAWVRDALLAAAPDRRLTLGLHRTDAEVCAQQPFFASAQVASRWLADHPGGRHIPVRSFHAEARRLVDRLEATPPATPMT